jgi:amino acid permease
MKKGFLELGEAVAVLTGTIVGAGVLAIPYAMMKAGFLTGALLLLALGIASILTYLYIGEVVLRTRKKHQLTGYAQKYLGSGGRRLMTFSMVFGNYGALIAYLIGIGGSFSALFGIQNISFNILGLVIGTDIIFTLLFFVFGSSIVYFGIRRVEESEFIMMGIVLFILFLLSVLAFFHFDASNVLLFDFSKIFVPYGVVLFALAGAVAVPEMREGLKNGKKLKKAVLIGSLIPVILYFIFSLAVVGACGKATTEIAVVCLAAKFGNMMLLLGNIFAIFAMATSFFALGLGLKEMYNYDYKIKEKISWFLACFIPLIIFFLILLFVKQDRFFKTIGITGGIAMTLEGILIVLMFNKAKKLGERKPEYSVKANKIVSALLILIFLLGMIYTILEFFGVL